MSQPIRPFVAPIPLLLTKIVKRPVVFNFPFSLVLPSALLFGNLGPLAQAMLIGVLMSSKKTSAEFGKVVLSNERRNLTRYIIKYNQQGQTWFIKASEHTLKDALAYAS